MITSKKIGTKLKRQEKSKMQNKNAQRRKSDLSRTVVICPKKKRKEAGVVADMETYEGHDGGGVGVYLCLAHAQGTLTSRRRGGP